MRPQHPHRPGLQRFVNACLRWGLIVVLISCSEKQEQGSNRLANSESPYLREHADNPVHWYQWCDDAFERAKKENKPVIVSIGYTACHWCHVMEKESFMDPDVAKIMNENFISIKVDREERPDIDQQFIYASQALTGTAGWPLNAFALQDGKPFHTITYYPKEAWIDLLNRVAAAWKADSNKIKKQAASLTQNIKPLFAYHNPDSVLRLDLKAFLHHVPASRASLDFKHGGLKGAPKFPMPSVIEFMLQYSQMTGDNISKQWVLTTLNAMSNGGIYDQIGGGFMRYSTDSLWHVPHFEKMLYDNALLTSVYANTFKATKNKAYQAITNEVVAFVQRELIIADSAFAASIDADSEGEEGKYYLWTRDDLKATLNSNAESAAKLFQITEGNQIPRLASDRSTWTPKQVQLQKALLEERNKRTQPTLDTKIVTSWNAMMIVGLIDAAHVTPDTHASLAHRTAKYLDKHLVSNEKVYRSMLHGGKPSVEGFLDDYAWLAKAYIHLYQFDFDIEWLVKAKKIADLAIQKFKDPNSPFFFYSVAESDSRVIRNLDLYDQAIPSSNSVFAEVLLMLGEYYQEPHYTKLAEEAIKEMVSSLDLNVTAISNWARLAQIVDFGYYEVAVVGKDVLLSRNLQAEYLPATIFMGGPVENLPLLENKLIDDRTIIYVCRNRVCKQPTLSGSIALQQIVYK